MRAISAAILAGALLPISAAAAPAPSPPLDRVLVAPPDGYTVLDSATLPTSPLHGFFGESEYAAGYGSNVAEATRHLEEDGFLGGYGLAWTNRPAHHVLAEAVLAFAGQKGAKEWLSYAEASDQRDTGYQRADSMTGLGTYYGEHYVFPTHDVLDAFIFLKGNDLFIVGFESTADDVFDLTVAQTQAQYAAAPDTTIPPSQWAENLSPPSGNSLPDLTTIAFVVAGLFIVGVLARAAMVLLRGQPTPKPVAWQLPPSSPMPVGQRSPDGAYWWDGYNWRPMPPS